MIQRFILILLIPVLLISCANSHTTVSTLVAIGNPESAFLAAYGPPPILIQPFWKDGSMDTM